MVEFYKKSKSMDTSFLSKSPDFGNLDINVHKGENNNEEDGLMISLVFTNTLRLFLQHATNGKQAAELLHIVEYVAYLDPESKKATLESDFFKRCNQETGLHDFATAFIVEQFDLKESKAVVLLGSVRSFSYKKRGKLCRPLLPLAVLVYNGNSVNANEFHHKLMNKYISQIRSSHRELKDRYVTCIFTEDNDLFSPYSALDICYPYANLLGYGDKLQNEAKTLCSSEVYHLIFGSDDKQFMDESSLLYVLKDKDYVKKRLELFDACDPDDQVERNFVGNNALKIHEQFGLANKIASGYSKPTFEAGKVKQLLKQLPRYERPIGKSREFIKTLSKLAKAIYEDLLDAAVEGPGQYTCHIRPANFSNLTEEHKLNHLIISFRATK